MHCTFLKSTILSLASCFLTLTVWGSSVATSLVIEPGPPQIGCVGDIITLGADPLVSGGVGPYQITWHILGDTTDHTGLSDPYIAEPNFTLTTDVVFGVIVEDALGEVCSSQISVSVFTVSAGADATYCPEGLPITIGTDVVPDAAAVYTWEIDGMTGVSTGLNSSSIPKPAASPSISTIYRITGTYNACSATDIMTVVVGSNTANAGIDEVVCIGAPTTLGGVANPGDYAYVWSDQHGFLDDPTDPNPILTATFVPATNPYDIYLTAISTEGCILIDTISITVGDAPDLSNRKVEYCNPNVRVGEDLPDDAGNTYAWSETGNPSSTTDISLPSSQSPLIFNPGNFTVTVTNSTGCSSTHDIAVSATCDDTPGDCVVQADYCITSGESVNIGINTDDAISFSWTPTTNLANSSESETIATPAFSTIYTLTVNYATYTCAYNYFVNIAPNITDAPDITLCQNESATIGSNGLPGWSYAWSPTIGLSDPNIDRPTFTSSSASSLAAYVVTGTNPSFACVTKDTILIEVVNDIANAGDDMNYCSGSAMIIGSPAKPNVTYTWSGPDLDDESLAQPTATPTGTVTYTLNTINNITGCSNTDMVTLTEIVDITADAGGTTIDICNGGSTILGGADMSDMGYIYNWSPVDGLSDPSAANPVASPMTTTTYTLTVQNSAVGCIATDMIEVTINATAGPSADAGTDLSSCVGSSVNIGTPAVAGNTYLWTPSVGLDNAAIAAPTATVGQVAQLYTLRVEDAGGCISHDQVLVSPVSISIDAGLDQVVCIGDSIHLGEATEAGMTYSWSPTVGLSDHTISNPKAAISSTITYTLTKTDGATCSISDDVMLTVIAPPSTDAGAAQSICDMPITIGPAAPDANYTYSWSPLIGLDDPTIANPSLDPNLISTATTYELTVTDMTTGCSGIGNVTVTPEVSIDLYDATVHLCADPVTIGMDMSADHTYAWSPAVDISNTAISNPEVAPASTTTYTVTVTNTVTSCAKTALVEVIVDPIPSLSLEDILVCSDVNTLIGVTDVDISSQFEGWNWSPVTDLSDANVAAPTFINPQHTTTFIVSAMHTTTGCTVTDTIVVNVDDQVGIVADAGADISICQGANTLIGAPSLAGLDYAWSPTIGINDYSIAQPTVSPAQTTTYTLTVTDAATGCIGVDQVTVTVDDLGISAGTDIVACKNGRITLSGSDLGPGYTYLWTPSYGMDDPTIPMPSVLMSNPTTFALVVTETATGCTASDMVFVDVSTDTAPSQVAGINQTICFGEEVALGPIDDGTSSYTWSPSTGLDDDMIANPIASPSISTDYTLVINTANCTTTSVVTITVQDEVIADAGEDQHICQDGNTTIGTTGIAGLTYSWSPVIGLSDPNSPTPVASPSASTIYTLTAEDTNGCKKSDDVIVIVTTSPIAIAGSDVAICDNGEYVQIGSNPQSGQTYSWAPATGLNNTSVANPIASPAATTTYSLTVSDTNSGCTTVDMVTISVSDCAIVCPTLDALVLSQTEICSGASLDANIYRSQNIESLSLYYNTGSVLSAGEIYAGAGIAIDDNIEIEQSVVINELTYWGGDTIELWNTGADTIDISAWWLCSRFNYAPINTLTLEAGDLNIVPGAYVVLTGFAFDDQSADVGIYSSNSFSSSAAMVDFIQYGGSGIGRASVAAAKGIWTAGAFIAPVTSIGETISYDGDGNDITDWSTFTSSTYFADNTNKTANVETSYSGIILPENNTTAPIDYNVYAALGTGDNLIDQCSLLVATTVTVHPAPALVVSADAGICLGDTAHLSVSGGVSYSWTPVTNIDDANAATPNVYPTSTTTYYVDVLDINGCMNRDSVTITIQPIPDLVTTDIDICNGESVDLATLVIDNNGSTGSMAYFTSMTDAINETGSVSQTVNPSSTTTYYIRKNVSSSSSCYDITSVTITIVSAPMLVVNDISICVGSFADLSSRVTDSNGIASDLNFYPTQLDADNETNPLSGTFVNPVATTTYYARKNAVLPAMCFDIEPIVLTVVPHPDLVVSNDTICFGSSVSLETMVTDINTTPGTYTFYTTLEDAQNVINAISATISPLDTTTYYVRKETSTVPPCSSIDSIKVYVESCNFDIALRKSLSSGQATAVAPGDTVSFDITVYNQGIVTAYDVLVTDYLDPNTTLVSTTWIQTGMNATRTIDMIASGDSMVLTIAAQVNPTYIGETIINAAEISYATNIDGRMVNIMDIDSNPNNINGDDIGGTLNDPNQDDVISDDGTIDEDDHDVEDVAVIQTFDLSLIHTFTTGEPATYLPGEIVSLDVEVTNEGTLRAYDISVINYDVPGLLYLDGGWIDEDGYFSFEIPFLDPGTTQTLTLRYTVDPYYSTPMIINNSEIAFATQTDGSGMNTMDEDSAADTIEANNVGEDDYSSINIPIMLGFDLALRKVLSPGQSEIIYPGDTVNFDIQIYNQGVEDAFDIVITDYLPAETELVSDTWILNGGNAEYTIADLTIGQDTLVQIAIKTDAAISVEQLINIAEISFATDIDDSAILKIDQDSEYDSNLGDLGGRVNIAGEDDEINDPGINDEDDHDPEDVIVCQVVISASTTNPSCFGGSDGAIDVMVTGGTGPYLYQWADGFGFDEDLTSLSEGNYILTVTDQNGCVATSSIVITDPEIFNINAISSNADCGMINGSITLAVTGANPTTYDWSDDIYDGLSTLTGLTAGAYDLTITDDLGCQKDTIITITNTSGLSVTADERGISCTGAADGFIGILTSGGTAPYTYDWSDDALDGLDTLVDLATGVYSVSVQDALNCMFTSTFTVTEPSVIQVDTAIQRIACAGDGNGIIDLNVSGGTAPYMYTWNNGLPAQQDQVGISAGLYQYTITDANNCQFIDSVIINEPTDFVISAMSNGPVCEGETLQLIGTNAVSYDWTGPSGFTSMDDTLIFNNATPNLNGLYTLRASNINACRDTIEVVVEVYPTTPTVSLINNTTVCNINLGSSENIIDLNNLLISGDMSGTWSDTDGSGALNGSVFTATPNMADLSYEFTYTLSAPGMNDCGDRTYTITVDVIGCGFRLALDKTVTVTGNLGDTILYTLTVNNRGAATAYDVVVQDHLPTGLIFEQSLNSGWVTNANGTSFTFFNPIPAGSNSSADIWLIIDENYQASSITNTSEITFATSTSGGTIATDINSTYGNYSAVADEDDESDVTIDLDQSFDLALTIELVPGQSLELSAGDPVTYNVIVSNQGSLDAYDVGIKFSYPIDLIFDAVANTDWSHLSQQALYSLDQLPSGTVDTIQIAFNLISGSETIAAQVISEITAGSTVPNGPISEDNDSSPNNNIPSEDDQDEWTIEIDQTYDLAITITASSDSIDVGVPAWYSLIVTNESTLPADDVTLVVYVPEGFNLLLAMNPGWTAGTNNRYYYTINNRIGVGLSETPRLILIPADDLLEGNTLVLSAEIVSGSFMTGGVLLSDDDGTFDDISSNDPSTEDNHDSIALHVRMGGCGNIVFNGTTVVGETCLLNDGSINIDINNVADYSYTWSPNLGTANANNNMRTGLSSGRYNIIITEINDPSCIAEISLDIDYNCASSIDVYNAYIPQNGILEFCMDNTHINLPTSVSNSAMCNDGSSVSPNAVIGSIGSTPECITLQAMNDFVGKFPEMLCVIHCTDDIVPICDTTLIDVTVVPQIDIESVQIPSGQPTTVCLDSDILQMTTIPTYINVCDEGSTTSVVVSQWDGNCVALHPASGFTGVSTDTICIVACYENDLQLCDTTYVVVEVTNENCPEYFDQSLIVQTGDDMNDVLELVIDAPYFGFEDNYTLTNNGIPYTGNLTPTDYDSLRYYDVTVPFSTASPTYNVEWSHDGINQSNMVNNLPQLLNLMQAWDPNGNWSYNPIDRRIETRNLTSTYGMITLNDGLTTSPVSIKFERSPKKVIVEVPTGLNVLVIPEICADTVTVAFTAPSASVVYDTVYVLGTKSYCLDISELTTNPETLVNYCISSSGDNANITLVGDDPCIDIEGLVIGYDTACVVMTDEYGFQDTVTYHLYVRDTAVGPPVALSDTIQIFKNQVTTVPVLMNDDTISAVTSMLILGQSLNGSATLNPDNTISFVPNIDYCSDSETQLIHYQICNIDGCDIASVEVQVLCDEMDVNNGFSPNGDGINDAFYIDAALLYPNNELRVYNRWGTQVMFQEGYKNDWEGDWDGLDLPDGVYWYTFDTGEGQNRSGYVVLYRN